MFSYLLQSLVPQMEVGLAAADAIRQVHGKNYTVGTSPAVLCKYMHKLHTCTTKTSRVQM